MKTKESLPDNLCDKCEVKGMCCSFTVFDEKTDTVVYLPNIACQFLDEDTGGCTVYENRYEKNPYCLSMQDLAKQGGCPPGCLYADKLDFKFPKSRIADKDEEEAIIHLMARDKED